jgi:thioredoxin-dependent peroxiredoxin
MLKVGDRAPAIDLPASDGTTFHLADRLREGRWVVLYFFPAAFTPGCTAESKRFRDNAPELRELGADVVGISTDDHKTQCRFAESMAVTFPILADEGAVASRAYGVLWPLLERPRRATFVISPSGTIEAVFWHEIQVSKHLDDVFAFLRKRIAA